MKDEKNIVNKNDFQVYLISKPNLNFEIIHHEIDFWKKKYKKSPDQFIYLIKIANAYSHLFELKGSIEDLYNSDKLLILLNDRCKWTNSSVLRALAKNYITQHRFKEALAHLDKAYALGDNKKSTNKMLFDVYMELGNYKIAQQKLADIEDYKDIDFLIRLAKWNDHKGDLEKAIEIMEKAKSIADDFDDDVLKVWIYSNIADYYGHNNQMRKAYDYYLKTLKIDNHNSYALKGIAWIAFSFERNPELALEILNYLEKNSTVPDLFLMKLKIADFQKDISMKSDAIIKYNQMISENNYGDMYNKYNFMMNLGDKKMKDKALKIAETEIKNRPTPDSYDMLAWAFYNNGNYQKALEIAKLYTIGKSHEPLVLYHNAEILKANRKLKDLQKIKQELKSSIFELGPEFEEKILKL